MDSKLSIKDFMFRKLSSDTAELYPDQSLKVLCPACFNFFPSSGITLAHIIPKSFNGRKYSLLCARCNNSFGTKQDKWFGEYLNLISDENALITDAKSKSKYIVVNHEKYRGNIKTNIDGVLEVSIIHHKKEDSLKPLGPTVSISQDIHLLTHENEVSVGYLTAAYLLWFSSYGYSWALQDILNIVRLQMAKPSELIIEDNYLIDLNGFHNPCIGLLRVDEVLLPSALIYDKIVWFPSAERLSSYNAISKLIKPDLSNVMFNSIAKYDNHKHPAFFGVVCGDQKIIMPQPFLNREMTLKRILYFESPQANPEFLYLESE